MFDLTDKVAIVTGGSRGIGRSVCVALAQAGAYVVVNFRSGQAAAEETLALVTAAGGQGEVLGFDVADPDATEAAVKDVAARKGRLDILVNNAGVAIDQLLARVKLAAVGEGMTLHPSMRVMARFDEPVHGWRGALQSMHTNAFFHERITLMSVFVPTGVLTATMPGIACGTTTRRST